MKRLTQDSLPIFPFTRRLMQDGLLILSNIQALLLSIFICLSSTFFLPKTKHNKHRNMFTIALVIKAGKKRKKTAK